MKSWTWMLIVILTVTLSAWAAGPAPLKIKSLKNNVNLRAKPIPTAEVVGQVSANDILISKSMDGEWVEIVPPTNVNFYVLGDYVKDGVIQCRQKVNVRSGPGINFTIVGQLVSAKKVIVRGAAADWVKIAPPESCSVWISRSLVEVMVDQPARAAPAKVKPVNIDTAKVEPVKAEPVKPAPVAAKKPEDKPAAKPQTSKVALERSTVPVIPRTNDTGVAVAGWTNTAAEAQNKPPADLVLIPSLGQGQWKQYDGTLRPRGVLARTPSRYRLVSYDTNGNARTVCYVKGNNDQLSTLINRPMIISGREYWVQRQNYPVLIPDRIVLK
ncbi:MAG: SH3 domain-containing protein [Verrucomicrobia bacterium]|nr:SH3 domain-containing protein [Verrucomicrobiota bacterium]MBU4430118.1 SH3 domain-containing protein [Verrucomicrobiota bacterium]MCG2680353.1 SH3 domain-containing protein [Kiritimatiellia bacterium]